MIGSERKAGRKKPSDSTPAHFLSPALIALYGAHLERERVRESDAEKG